MYALTRPGRSSTGPFSVKIFRNRGPEIARSQPVPDCDLNSDNFQLSNAGLQRFTTSRTAAVSWLRSPASPSCGQLIEIDIPPYLLSVSTKALQTWLFPFAPSKSRGPTTTHDTAASARPSMSSSLDVP